MAEKKTQPKTTVPLKPHYVCIGGCGKTEEIQMKCTTPFCWRARNPLGECTCKNGKHTAFYKMYNPDMLKKDIQPT